MLALIVLATAGRRTAAAQADDRDPPLLPRCELGLYGGVAWNSPAGRRLGIVPDRDHVFIGVQLAANLFRSRRWAFAYAPEVVPLLVVSDNPKYEHIPLPGGGAYTIENGTGPVAGIGISPLGVEVQTRVTSRWRLDVRAAAGVVWFTRDVPVAYSRAFNYTFQIGGGARWQYRPRASLRFGYMFHHLSNAYTAYQNPGLDAMVFVVGYERVLGSDQGQPRVSPGPAQGQARVSPGSGPGQPGVRPGSAQGQARVSPGSGPGQPGVRPGSDQAARKGLR